MKIAGIKIYSWAIALSVLYGCSTTMTVRTHNNAAFVDPDALCSDGSNLISGNQYFAMDDVVSIEKSRPDFATKIWVGAFVASTVIGTGASYAFCESLQCAVMGTGMPPFIIMALAPAIYFASYETIDVDSVAKCKN
jgi:hypothetical protein